LHTPTRPELTAKSIELMYFQASNAYSSSIAAGAILAVLFWNQAPRLGIAAWAISYAVVIAIRHLLGIRFRAAPRRAEDAQRWLNYFATVVGISGVIWGVYGAFLAQHASDPYDLAVVLLALGALLSGAVVAYSVSMSVYLAFSIPTMVPIALWLTLSPVDGKRFLGLMVFVWIVFMLFAARRFRRFALESLGYQCNMEELASQLKKLSCIDSLTNLPTRRGFDEDFDAAVARAQREAEPLGLILCNVDAFEHYNEAHGAMHGDVCLRSIASQLDTLAKRNGAWVARTGGEAFAVVLPQAGADAPLLLAEELRDAIERLGIVHAKSQVSSVVTASFGVASMIAADGSTGSDLLQRAEEALREAKRTGRNRVCSGQSAATANADASGAMRSEGPRGLKSARV
jgi:diguanylate cyclase (GGDEF)-like protein